MEVWKDIPNYEGYYQVSNLGNVKSLQRKGCKFDRVLKTKLNKYGYKQINLFMKNIPKTYEIHKLVAMAFLGHIPNGLTIVVDHINNISSDNRLENLQIISNRENLSKNKKGKSIYTGVYFCKEKKSWVSRIFIDKKNKHLGRFKDEIDAHNAYQNALKELLNEKNQSPTTPIALRYY